MMKICIARIHSPKRQRLSLIDGKLKTPTRHLWLGIMLDYTYNIFVT